MKELLGCLYKLQEEREESKKSGQVIIQTYNPDNFCIEYAKKQDYEGFYNTEISIRKSLNYPPFCDIIMFGISGTDETEIIKASNELYKLLQKNTKNIYVYKPVSAPVDKIKNKYRWRIIAKCKLSNSIIDSVNNALDEFYKLKHKNVTVIVDINPSSMM